MKHEATHSQVREKQDCMFWGAAAETESQDRLSEWVTMGFISGHRFTEKGQK